MIRVVVIVGSLLIVSGAVYSSIQQPEQKHSHFFTPEWKSFQVQSEILCQGSDFISDFGFIDEEGIRISKIPQKPFRYSWVGVIRSANSSLVLVKDVQANKEWIIAEGDHIPESECCSVDCIGNETISLFNENTGLRKLLPYGKQLQEDPAWKVEFPNGEAFVMKKGDIISVAGEKWKLTESSSDPPHVLIQRLNSYVSGSASNVTDANSL
jgi:hypothetical protein